ncbi:hypothetical protein BO82DRAFT_430445 [Aspergillus uvarum CBS 121591]|uniref:Uncharacterized protein n=1 Tax=Aspergillus uvarum CBS 121591 TaxID=1448315 RepID=A0A319CHP4_9EURO|nr:hypothetical protein BO82DRAFT_430445 [Aspergillus uvarum CBS 121591]PYH83970.1 hypothetical protein BO82DRAFT_430445 [Aspergillus uvarum CBS 121591]
MTAAIPTATERLDICASIELTCKAEQIKCEDHFAYEGIDACPEDPWRSCLCDQVAEHCMMRDDEIDDYHTTWECDLRS